jgi:hypothetical protein
MFDVPPITIEPEAWYTDGQARLLLGLSSAATVSARRAGTLRFTRVGRRVLYLGRWLLDWLERKKHEKGRVAARPRTKVRYHHEHIYKPAHFQAG